MGPLYVGAGAVVPDSPAARRAFTWVDAHGEEYRAYRDEGDGTLSVPRRVFGSRAGVEDRTVLGQAARFARANISLKPDQAPVVAEARRLLDRRGAVTVEASTGKGKTYMAMELIRHLGRKTLVVVPKADLVRGTEDRWQWWEHLVHVLGVPESRIGVWRGDAVGVAGKDVTIGILKSMAKQDRYPRGLCERFGLVVIDELQTIATDTFQGVAFNFPARYLVGLSATPDRKDGRSDFIQAHLGDARVSLRSVPMSPRVYRYHWSMPALSKIPHGGTTNGHVLKALARNAKRNAFIAHLAGAFRRKGRKLVVFSHSVDHLEALAPMLRREGIRSEDVGFYVAAREDSDGKKRRQSAEALDKATKKPVVLATYGLADKGTNCPWWDSCIMAIPRGDPRQPVGRVLREHPGKKQPVVVDIVDFHSRLFLGWGHARDAYYKGPECGAEVVTMDVPGEFR